MHPAILYLIRLFFYVIPETRLFRLKAWLLRIAGVHLGKNVRICSSSVILGNGHLWVGDETWIGPQVLISSGSQVIIGNSVDIAPRVYIGTGTHKIDRDGMHSAGAGVNMDVVIGDGVWLGIGSVVLPGVTIGDKSVVSAGAVVKENVPPRVLVGGVPARVIRELL
jgi:acetyltransferase-like isoleucine patch superfamily enzyme